MKLREYQEPVVRAVSAAYVEGKQGIIMQMPTGAGKTASASFIVSKYVETGRQMLWLVHRNELLLQACMTFSAMGIEHRLICSEQAARKIKVMQFKKYGRVFLTEKALAVVSSVQTLIRRLDQVEWLKPSQIIADECHLSLNTTFRTIIGHWPDARLLGLSATPTREDGQCFDRANGGLYDDLVQGPQPYELMDMGMLADYELCIPPVPFETKRKKIKRGDYDAQDLEQEFTMSVYGSVVEHYKRHSDGLPAIGFCPTVNVAQKMTEKFIEAGYRAATLEGNTDPHERWEILDKLANGQIDVVMSVDILIEGTDVPLATTALLLRKTKSVRIYLQSIGRVLRPHPAKRCAIIMDFVGMVAEHGYPDDHRDWTLEGKSTRKPRPTDPDQTPDVKVKTCPRCFRGHKPAPICPNCGHEYGATLHVEEAAGDLMLVTRAKTPEEKAAADALRESLRKEKRLEERYCETLEDWVKLAKQRNYKFPVQWAKRRYELRCKRRA